MTKKLIPKAQFGTGIVKRGLKWLSNHVTPTQEQTQFEVQNQQRISKQQSNKDNKKQLQKKSSIKQLQQQLLDKGFYKGAVDGIVGQKTRAAIAMAGINGYDVVDNKLIRKKLKEENLAHLKKQEGTFSINNPIIRTIQDLFQAKRNKLYNDVAMDPTTGMPLFTKPKSQTIKRIPLSQALVLQELIEFKGTPKSGSFKNSDWKALQGTYTGGNRSVIERSFGPLQSIEHCLGQFSWHTNDSGEVIVTDTFDWNVGNTSKNQGWYTKARDYMGEHGTSSEAPSNEKTKYEINLGKPENW